MIDFKTVPNEVIAIYGILQLELKLEGVLSPTGVPIKAKYPESTQDALSLYKWLSQVLLKVYEKEINQRKNAFNTIVKGLTKEYLLNMSLLGVFMLERLLTDSGNKAQIGMYMPKVNRLIRHLSKSIILENSEHGRTIVKDSKIGASNVMRVFGGEIELTKTMRAWRRRQWKK